MKNNASSIAANPASGYHQFQSWRPARAGISAGNWRRPRRGRFIPSKHIDAIGAVPLCCTARLTHFLL
jgi:hypothetical protein